MFREKWVIERNIKCTNKSGHTDTARSCVVGCVWELQGLIFISKQVDLALITGLKTFLQMIYSPTIVW